MSGRKIFILGTVITVLGLSAFIYLETNKPQFGQKFDDLGRTHIQIGEKVDYNSNPPTSGNHYEDWTRPVVSDTVKDDRNILHSMEHGYIIMWYKCPGVGPSITDQPTEATTSASGSEGDCKQRKDQLSTIFTDKGEKKLIIAPRADLDTNFAVSAWTRLDKFNDFEQKRIEQFISAYRNQGPERTME